MKAEAGRRKGEGGRMKEEVGGKRGRRRIRVQGRKQEEGGRRKDDEVCLSVALLVQNRFA